MKKQPLRMCVSCREMKNKNQLLRVVRNKDKKIKIDLTGKADGRGAYICKCSECINKLQKNRILNKIFSQKIEESLYDEIRSVCDEQ